MLYSKSFEIDPIRANVQSQFPAKRVKTPQDGAARDGFCRFAAKLSVRSCCNQKKNYRAFKELSIGLIQHPNTPQGCHVIP